MKAHSNNKLPAKRKEKYISKGPGSQTSSPKPFDQENTNHLEIT